MINDHGAAKIAVSSPSLQVYFKSNITTCEYVLLELSVASKSSTHNIGLMQKLAIIIGIIEHDFPFINIH